MEDLDSKFEFPNQAEINWGPELVGRHISIFWDGDQVYFPCTVVKFDDQRDKIHVLYENDPTGRKYVESLRRTVWKLWKGTEEEYKQLTKPQQATVQNPVVSESVEDESPPAQTDADKINKSNKNPTYSVMVLEAVINLNEKEGSSLNAVRKYILAHYNIQKQQVASFNNLTLKAVNKAVASNELEKIKHSFRLTASERERRKEFDKRMNAANEFDLKKMGFFSGTSRKYSPFVIDSMSLSGITNVHNKSLRRELLESRNRRDRFLRKRMHLLKPFLPESKDYFTRRDLEEENMKEQRVAHLAIKQSMLSAPKANPMLPNGVIPGTDEDDELFIAMQTQEPTVLRPENVIKLAPDVATALFPPQLPSMNGNISVNGHSSQYGIIPTVGENGHAMPPPTAMIPSSVLPTPDGEEPIIDENKLFYSTLDGVEKLEPSPILTAVLHEHQIVGISWMVHMFKNGMPMILGDQMGLGKTIQTIGFLAYLQTGLNKKGPHVIVVPLSVLSNWLAEIEKFCPSFRAVRFHGPKMERERIKTEELNDLSEFDIVVTTFEILVSEINFFRRKYVWTTVVIDEGHRLKNEKSQLSEKLRCVPCVSKVVLTGTPLQNNLHELWAILYYLSPDIFQSSEPFDEGFDLLRGFIDNSILRRARKLLSVFMLRRLKENVAIQLPSKKEITVLVPLTDQQIELYKLILCGLDTNTIEIVMREGDKDQQPSMSSSKLSRTASHATIASSSSSSNMTGLEATMNGGKESTPTTTTTTAVTITATSTATSNDTDWRKLMNILMQLRKTCNHTYLLPHIAPEPYEITDEIVTGSGKLLMLDRMLPKLRTDGHRVLLFSQFTSMLDILEDYCELRDYPFVRLDGETNRVKRRLDCRRFNATNSNLFIFLISTRAGGLGLNLASADTVILYDSDWNPQVDLQAMERAHRIGQVKPVRVFRLICRGSVEERMISRAEKKLFLNAMVAEIDPDEQVSELHDENGAAATENTNMIEALGFGGGSAMSKAEIASLIRFGANAIIESESTENSVKYQLSEEELDTLLERQGRDNTPIIPAPPKPMSITTVGESITAPLPDTTTAATTTTSTALTTVMTSTTSPAGDLTSPVEDNPDDVFEKAQAVLKDRMEMLQEVDLRQLGNMLYTKKKEKKTGRNSIDNLEILEKRQSKKRIVMIDGKGSGYGGAVPILAENLKNEMDDVNYNDDEGREHEAKEYRFRGRTWVHRNFCTLCGKSHVTISPLMKCAHCPFLFHQHCLLEHNQLSTKGMGMFICSHHRCADCNRSTASAGGLLFRCNGCLTSYCEDCLPQDEIDSFGRCRDLEIYGYHSKQAYYIKCPSCCEAAGYKPGGVLGDQNLPPAAATTSSSSSGGVPTATEKENEDAEDTTTTTTPATPAVVNTPMEGEGDEDEPVVVEELKKLPTQYLRIEWTEILDPPPKPSKSKASKRKRKSSSGGGSKKKKAPATTTPKKKNGKVVEEVQAEEDEEDEGEEEEDGITGEAEESGGEEEDAPDKKLRSLVSRDIAHPDVPVATLLADGLAIFFAHPAYLELTEAYDLLQTALADETAAAAAVAPSHPAIESSASKKARSKPVINLQQEVAIIVNKVDAGRYRSPGQFVGDILYIIEAIMIKFLYQQIKNKDEKQRIQYVGKSLLQFVKENFEPCLVLTKVDEDDDAE